MQEKTFTKIPTSITFIIAKIYEAIYFEPILILNIQSYLIGICDMSVGSMFVVKLLLSSSVGT